MIKTHLLRNSETGELALRMQTLGVDICWRIPPEAHGLEPQYLKSYIDDLLPKMEAEVIRLKKETRERLKRKHGRKATSGKKLKENIEERNPRPAQRTAPAADGPSGV